MRSDEWPLHRGDARRLGESRWRADDTHCEQLFARAGQRPRRLRARISSIAQAAWDCTNGSGSVVASVRAGTSDSVPTFPSATAALRLRPRNFARFIAEPLNVTVYSSGVISSRALASLAVSLVSSSGRARNASSRGWRANFTFHGQTS